MAGEWIKVDSSIHKKPEVIRAARILEISVDSMVGHLLRFWGWLDAVTVDGCVDGVLSHDVDAIVGVPKFCDALKQVSWLDFDDAKQAMSVPNFEHHNGETAKKRALKNRRQAKWRSHKGDGAASTQASTREEKRREYKKPIAMELPDWVPGDKWAEFVKMRKAGKSPFTDHAQKVALAKLTELRGQGCDPGAAIDAAILHGWKSFYPPKGGGTVNPWDDAK